MRVKGRPSFPFPFPATPDVIIAGDPTTWRPARLETELWTRLRVTYLQKAWDAHCVAHRGGPTPSPTSIAAATLHAAVQSMRTEFSTMLLGVLCLCFGF